jgi:hypothetical protein
MGGGGIFGCLCGGGKEEDSGRRMTEKIGAVKRNNN